MLAPKHHRSGAQVIQIFDSWGGQLPPHLWEKWSKPYIQQIVNTCKAEYPDVPLTLYANGSGGLLERMGTTGVDTIGLDWTIDMADARARLGPDMTVQGNVDPAVLFADTDAITAAMKDCCSKAGSNGHILNLGHGVLVGTPEENVKHFFDTKPLHALCKGVNVLMSCDDDDAQEPLFIFCNT